MNFGEGLKKIINWYKFKINKKGLDE